MGSQKDNNSDVGDAEDNIPSDFFDDFNKDDFMNGLSVIDSWDDDDNKRPRIDLKTLDSVKDLRELIDEGRVELVDGVEGKSKKTKKDFVKFDDKFRWRKEEERTSKTSEIIDSNLDDYIKPGSRRDPNKTNEAIKKDKEVKVKEYLAKHLEASDDLRPPGTELDDYFTAKETAQKKKSPTVAEETKSRPTTYRPREHRRSIRESPVRSHRSPRRSPRRSPNRAYRSPIRDGRRRTPSRRFSPRRFSPRRTKRQWSPRRQSPPRRSPRRSHRSRSPRRTYSSRRSRTPTSQHRDSFLYPHAEPSMMYPPADASYQVPPATGYPGDYSGGIPPYSYPQGPYAGYGGPGYEYEMQPNAPVIPQPQPVPAPLLDPVPLAVPALSAPLAVPAPIGNAPEMVPPPSQIVSPSNMKTTKPYDALAQLVAEGKLSKEDYLKLAPNKGMGSSNLDAKTRVMVLNRCNQALSKLTNLLLPNRLVMNNNVIGQEPKCLAPKFCSPLKRQAVVEFQFTKNDRASVQHNKQLVDSIISTIGLDKLVARPKKKPPKDMKDAAVQTVRAHCDVCEIRDSTKQFEVGTSTDPEYFSSSIHTQVVEQDLINSKSIFNPTGGASSSAPISIAHLTPAQLVSQLAARAKTLKETEPMHSSNQFGRRNPPNNYDNRGGQYNNYNYRY